MMTPRCPVNSLIQLLSKRWNIFILYSIAGGKSSFNEIKRMNPGMSAKILSERLQELESEDLIVRKVSGVRPIKIDYLLTPKGESLGNVLKSVNVWALENNS